MARLVFLISMFYSSLPLQCSRWVTAAKSLVAGVCAIDMLAGPSEVLIIADNTANPATVAADLLAQVCVGKASKVGAKCVWGSQKQQ